MKWQITFCWTPIVKIWWVQVAPFFIEEGTSGPGKWRGCAEIYSTCGYHSNNFFSSFYSAPSLYLYASEIQNWLPQKG